MTTAVLKVEVEAETCSVCGGSGDLFTPEEHDAGSPPMQVSLRTMLLQINNFKVVPEGRLCVSCIRRAIEAYEFSCAIGSKTAPPLSEKIRALRRRLHELTQKIDVFIVVGGPGVNSGGAYSEDDIIMVERDALAAAAAADDEDLEKARNACGDSVYQCTICPMSFEHAAAYRAHAASHPGGARHSCWTCGAQFARRDALRDHAAEHDAPSRVCRLCQASFQSASELRRHESSGSCAARCPAEACGARAASRSALSAHVAATHARSPPFLCSQCFAPCATRGALAAHTLSHRRAERFVCGYDACILRFANRGDLLSHIRKQHAGAAPEPASERPPSTTCHCGRTFGSVAALKRHARVHRRETQQEEAEWQASPEAMEGDVEYLELEALDDYDDH